MSCIALDGASLRFMRAEASNPARPDLAQSSTKMLNMSHAKKTPLASIGYVGTTSLTPDCRRYIQTMKR
jgi:hypothetical protein